MDSVSGVVRGLFTEKMPTHERLRHLGGALESLGKSLEAGAQARETLRRDTPEGMDPSSIVDSD